MAAINPPVWQQAGTYSARADRLGVISGFSGYSGFSTDESQPLRIRQGVRPSYQNYQLKVRPAGTPNMTVIVSAGTCVIDNHDLAGYGSYVCVNDADVTLTIGAADSTRYRRDTVVAQVLDAETSGSTSAWSLAVVSGPYAATAGAVTRGTLPPSAQALGDILVGPGVSSIGSGVISDARNYAVASGGIVPVPSGNDMDHPHPGQTRYMTDLDVFRYGRVDGTSGTIYPGLNYQQGSVSFTWTSGTAGQWLQTAVTFASPFTTTPVVHITPQGLAPAAGGSTVVMCQVTSVTTTGFTACAYRSTAISTQPFGWTAFQ